MKSADLHLHSHYSDGSDAPERIIARALRLGFSAIALTDHDTVRGVEEGLRAATEAGLEFLVGTEISASFKGREIHITAFGFDPASPVLMEALERLSSARNARADQILIRLADLGIALSLEDVLAHTAGKTISRMHIALALRAQGATKTSQQGFDQYLNFGRPAYVPKLTLPAQEALEAVHAAGGIAFLAHPGLSKFTRKNLPELMDLPFDGLEAYHVSHSADRTQDFLRFADERDLLVAGGSDCHGSVKRKPEMGNVRLPWDRYLRLRERLAYSPGTGVTSQ